VKASAWRAGEPRGCRRQREGFADLGFQNVVGGRPAGMRAHRLGLAVEGPGDVDVVVWVRTFAVPDLAHRPALQPLAVQLLEQTMVRSALDRTHGRVEEAARLLGISRKGLFLKRRRWGLYQPS